MFVKELEITLENGMKISGELDLPERQGQWKTIILFHGSGPSDRHATVESMGGIVSRNFDLLSEGFVKARYAVFRYDKRENYDRKRPDDKLGYKKRCDKRIYCNGDV